MLVVAGALLAVQTWSLCFSPPLVGVDHDPSPLRSTWALERLDDSTDRHTARLPASSSRPVFPLDWTWIITRLSSPLWLRNCPIDVPPPLLSSYTLPLWELGPASTLKHLPLLFALLSDYRRLALVLAAFPSGCRPCLPAFAPASPSCAVARAQSSVDIEVNGSVYVCIAIVDAFCAICTDAGIYFYPQG